MNTRLRITEIVLWHTGFHVANTGLCVVHAGIEGHYSSSTNSVGTIAHTHTQGEAWEITCMYREVLSKKTRAVCSKQYSGLALYKFLKIYWVKHDYFRKKLHVATLFSRKIIINRPPPPPLLQRTQSPFTAGKSVVMCIPGKSVGMCISWKSVGMRISLSNCAGRGRLAT